MLHKGFEPRQCTHGYLWLRALDHALKQVKRRRPLRQGKPGRTVHCPQGYALVPYIACDSLARTDRSEEHTSELQSLMRISYAVFCLKKTKDTYQSYKYNITS